MNNFVVYTAITSGYDILKEPPATWRDQAEFVAFLPKSPPATDWIVRPIYRRFKDPCRNAKIHKILPHRFFPDAEYSLWIDGTIRVITQEPLRELAEEFLRQHDIALFKHYARNCIYQEAVACIRGRADARAVIHRQMQKYFREGYPAEIGLAECSVIFRRHTRKIRELNEAWYAEIHRHSRRDQLSFNYVARKLGVEYAVFPGTLAGNDYFERLHHATPRAKMI